MRQAATGSFHAVELNVTASRETRIVAGKQKEKTSVASLSAWTLVSTPRERSRAPVMKMAIKAWSARGMELRVAETCEEGWEGDGG
jgi:hypothetical protein